MYAPALFFKIKSADFERVSISGSTSNCGIATVVVIEVLVEEG